MSAVTLDLVLVLFLDAGGPNGPLFGHIEITDGPNVVLATPICPTWWPNLRMAPTGGQMCNSCKWFLQLVGKFTIYTIGAICWKNLQLMQVVPPDGVIWN